MWRITFAFFMTLMFSFITSFLMGFYSEIAHEPGGLRGALLISSGATVIVVLSLIAWGIPLHLLFKSRGIFSPTCIFLAVVFRVFLLFSSSTCLVIIRSVKNCNNHLS